MAFDKDYSSRRGYDEAFLRPGKSDGRVFLPVLGTALARLATPLVDAPKSNVLHYHHYSVVMHRKRRFAIYSAANIDYRGRYALARPKDVWRLDPRIPAEAQVGEAFYANNQFDRGHLTRREDLEFGATSPAALLAAADTCHWTNCTPQHAKFNEGKQLWQGLELHILEHAVLQDHFRAQVLTGPVFGAKDPLLPGFADTLYPLRYWKIVAALDAKGALFATAYVLDQRGVIAEFGVKDAPAIPFTPYKTFQTQIGEIERLTGLAFQAGKGTGRVDLGAFDPLARTKDAGPLYRELGSVADAVLAA